MASITDLILGGVKTLANAAANNSQNNAAQSAATPASSVANTQSAPVGSASSGSNSYTPIGTHNDATVRQQSAQDTAQLQSLSNQWHAATEAGDTAAAAENKIRHASGRAMFWMYKAITSLPPQQESKSPNRSET
jgi:hypothetical protein